MSGNENGNGNGGGTYRVLLVLVALVAILAGVAAYDGRVDEKIERSEEHSRELYDVKLDAIHAAVERNSDRLDELVALIRNKQNRGEKNERKTEVPF